MTAGPAQELARKYRLVRRLGQGAMGTVWEAERGSDGRRVALKLLKRELLQDDKALHRFRREAKLSARLQHPNVVQTLEAGVEESSGQPWIAMELLPGPNLADWVREHGALSFAQARAVLRGVFSALARAHELGIVHRDLKPENVLLGQAAEGELGVAKVSDFGIAKGLAEKSWASTEAGLGTPLWTAPEQARPGFVPSPRADVWALGLLSYFLLTGRQYWVHANQRSSVADLVLELERSELEKASSRAAASGLAERLPAGFDAWFARSVSRKPEERFEDAGRSWAALEPILEPGRRPRARLAWAVAVLILAALAVALAFSR